MARHPRGTTACTVTAQGAVVPVVWPASHVRPAAWLSSDLIAPPVQQRPSTLRRPDGMPLGTVCYGFQPYGQQAGEAVQQQSAESLLDAAAGVIDEDTLAAMRAALEALGSFGGIGGAAGAPGSSVLLHEEVGAERHVQRCMHCAVHVHAARIDVSMSRCQLDTFSPACYQCFSHLVPAGGDHGVRPVCAGRAARVP